MKNLYDFLPPLDPLREHADGVERYRDADVAHWLGASVEDIRTLIERPRFHEQLEEYGKIPAGLGATGVGYWLNREQVLRLCMWVNSETAHGIQWLMLDIVGDNAEVREAILCIQLQDLEARERHCYRLP